MDESGLINRLFEPVPEIMTAPPFRNNLNFSLNLKFNLVIESVKFLKNLVIT